MKEKEIKEEKNIKQEEKEKEGDNKEKEEEKQEKKEKEQDNKDKKKGKGGFKVKGFLLGLGAAVGFAGLGFGTTAAMGVAGVGIGAKIIYDKFKNKGLKGSKNIFNYDFTDVVQEMEKRKNVKPKIVKDESDTNYVMPNSIKNLDDENIIKLKNTFICPISQKMMEDPVITPYGTTYEKTEILKWIESNKNDYVTKKPLDNTMLAANYMLKVIIEDYKLRTL
jgi:hypothetical protein